MRKDHQRSGLGERAYVPTLLLTKKMAEGSMCAKKKERKKRYLGLSLIEAPDVAGGPPSRKNKRISSFI